MTSPASLAAALLAEIGARRATLATAESLTGGLLGAALTSVPGSSAGYRGGVVAYATDLKSRLCAVDPALLVAVGPVHRDVATAMAAGVAARLGATYGVATTGVAGPGPQDGHPAGTVFVAVAGPSGASVRALALDGSRHAIRVRTVRAALELARFVVRADVEQRLRERPD